MLCTSLQHVHAARTHAQPNPSLVKRMLVAQRPSARYYPRDERDLARPDVTLAKLYGVGDAILRPRAPRPPPVRSEFREITPMRLSISISFLNIILDIIFRILCNKRNRFRTLLAGDPIPLSGILLRIPLLRLRNPF